MRLFSLKSFNYAILLSFVLFNVLFSQSVRTEQVIRLENPEDHSSYILLKAPAGLTGQHSVELPSTGIAGELPAGMVVPYAGNNAPEGWLLCDGGTYDVTTYSKLYNVIGTTYGGSGSTFNVPNLEGRVPVGASSSFALASTGGEETHILTVEEMPEHNHLLGARQRGSGSVPTDQKILDGGSYYNQNDPDIYLRPTAISNTGGGQAHNNMQPYLTLNYIIKY